MIHDMCMFLCDFGYFARFNETPKQKNLFANSYRQTGFSSCKKSLFRFSRISNPLESVARKQNQIGETLFYAGSAVFGVR